MKKFIILLLALLIPIIFFIGAMTLISQTPSFYSYEFDKLNTIEEAKIKISSQEVSRMMVDYIQGKRTDFQIQAEVNGKEQNLFNTKEQQHMEDVKKLIQVGNIVSIIGFLVLAVLYLWLFKKEKISLWTMYKTAVGACMVFLVGLILASTVDFNAAFDLFHEVLFANDLWILNPKKDILLMLMPLKFFIDAFVLSLIMVTGGIIILGVITWRITRSRNMFY